MSEILTSAELAALLGIDRKTVWNWQQSDVAFRGCVVRQTRRSTHWSVQRLRDRGYLTSPSAPVSAPIDDVPRVLFAG